MKSTIIANNIVVCDPKIIPTTRSIEYYTGIFYMCSNIAEDREKNQEPSLQITGNSIRDIDRGNRSPAGLVVHAIKILNYAKKMSSITVTDNHIRGINYCTAIEVTMNYPVFAKNTKVPSEGMQCKISGNQIYAQHLDKQAINIDYFDTNNLGRLGQITIKDNNIRVVSFGESPINITRGFQVAAVESNYIDIHDTKNVSTVPVIAIQTSANGLARIKDNNIVSLSPLANQNIKYGNNQISASNNRFNGSIINPIP
jgi:hypothetical protein